MQPILCSVLIKPLAPDEKSEQGIILPEAFRKRKNVGKVIATGNGTLKEPMLIKKGVLVYNIKDCGEPVEIDGVTHYLIQQRDILATRVN